MKTFAILLCLTCVPLPGQRAPVFQSETRQVLIDAVVTGKKGEYLRDLTAKDFRIWEDNREQPVQSLSPETASSAAEPRRLVLFFDEVGMSVADQASARQAAVAFIDVHSDRNQLMAVVSFDGAYHVMQGFTENAGRLKEAVRAVRFSGRTPIQPTTRNEGIIGDASTASAVAQGLIPSVADLARNLNAVPGHKIIVLLTGRWLFNLAQAPDVTRLIQMSNTSNVTVYPLIQGSAVQDASGTSFDLSQEPVRNFPATPGGNRPGPGNDNNPRVLTDDSLLFRVANETGGLVLSSSNDLVAELQKVDAEQSQYYVLGYEPPDSKEGACHRLRVKVDRRGATVRFRSSYCSAKPQDLLAESRVEQDLEKKAAATDTGTAASIQAPFFYAAPNVARVHVAMEMATDAVRFENVKGKLHAEINILGIASAPDGSAAARFSDIVRLDLTKKEDVDKWKEKPLHYEKEFKIIPGRYSLSVVFSSGGENFGKAETPLTIPAYSRGQFALSGIALSREARPASNLGLEPALIDQGTPLIAGAMQVIPTGSNVFTRSEQAFCYFEVYSPGAQDTATLHLRILDRKTGAQKWDGGVAKLPPPADSESTIPLGLSVPIGSLPSGSYVLEVTATDGADQTAKQTADFDIR